MSVQQDGVAVEVTEHGLKRARKRLGLSRRAAERMAAKAWALGTPGEAQPGLLGARLLGAEARDAVAKIYGEHVWLYDLRAEPPRLITVHAVKAVALVEALQRRQRRWDREMFQRGRIGRRRDAA